MALLPPPPSPSRVAFGDDDRLRRLRLRLWQVNVSAVTVCFALWCCTLGPIPAIVALMVAKEVLVAILVMGLGYAPVAALERPEGRPSRKLDRR